MSSPPRKPSVTADQALGADRELALLHTPAAIRPAVHALWSLDAAMADVVARSTEPTLAAIKLAWWRERLEELDHGPPPAEPRLRAAAEELLPRGISGARLGEIERGWATLLDKEVNAAAVAQRGALLFQIGAELLRSPNANVSDAGSLYALASVGRRGVPELFPAAAAFVERLSRYRAQRRVRPLTMLARAGARDVAAQGAPEPEGSRARTAAMLAHLWSGRVRA